MTATLSPVSDPVIDAAAANSRQYLTFTLAGESFAIGVDAIREIIEFGGVTKVPAMPRFVRGVINLRGAVVPVMDLGVRFSGREIEITRRSCIVIVEVGDGEASRDLGLAVDAVSAVIDIDGNSIEPVPRLAGRRGADFIHGLGMVDARFFVIVDAGKLVSGAEIESAYHAARA